MTPAITYLKKQKLPFDILSYQHDHDFSNYGIEAVTKLNLDAETVFKTLVCENDKAQLLVAIVPVNQQLNLKSLAKAAKCKKISMADRQKVERITGYVVGGVSPVGQKKRLTTFIDKSAYGLKIIYVSAGKRGLELALSPKTLQQVTNAKFEPITG